MCSLWFVLAIGQIDPPPLLPGVSSMGNTFDMLTASRDGLDRVTDRVFSFTLNQTTLDGKYSYPWGFNYGVDPECSRNIESETYKTYYDYKSDVQKSTTISGSFGEFSASFTSASEHVREMLRTGETVVNVARTVCQTHTLTLNPGFAPLDPMFVATLKALPAFPRSCVKPPLPQAWADFFRNYPPTVTTGCLVGGSMSQLSATQTTYLKNHTMDMTSHEANIKFFISIDTKSSKTVTVDQAWELDTSMTAVEAHGGTMATDDQWASWADSVQQFSNPACLDYTAIDLSELMSPAWTKDAELNSRAAEMETAIRAFYNRTGCTDITASNYNASALVDDGSCVAKYPVDQLRQLTSTLMGCNPTTWNTDIWGTVRSGAAQVNAAVTERNFVQQLHVFLGMLQGITPKHSYEEDGWTQIRTKAGQELQEKNAFTAFYGIVAQLAINTPKYPPKDIKDLWINIRNTCNDILAHRITPPGKLP